MSALQRVKRDPLPPELFETPAMRARCCAGLPPCKSYSDLHPDMGTATGKWQWRDPRGLFSNIARIYASHSEENKQRGRILFLEAPEPERFESIFERNKRGSKGGAQMERSLVDVKSQCGRANKDEELS